MLRLYGRIREAFGWTNRKIDRLTLAEAEEIQEHWMEEPPVGQVLRAVHQVKRATVVYDSEPAAAPVPRFATDEELDRISAGERAFAEKFGRGNPWQ